MLSVFARRLTGAQTHLDVLKYNKSMNMHMQTCTHAHMHTVHSLDSLTRQVFAALHTAQEEMPCGPKSLSSLFILFPSSAVCYSVIMISPFFFSSWVFMRGRLGAVIPVLYTTWHRPAVRPQRLVPTPDWTAILLRWCHQHPAGSGVKLFTLKAEEVKVTVATKSSFWESTTRL